MNLTNIQVILGKALSGHVINETFWQWRDDDENKEGYCQEITINRLGYKHRYVSVRNILNVSSDEFDSDAFREIGWQQAIRQIKAASLTREEHAAVDRALEEINK